MKLMIIDGPDEGGQADVPESGLRIGREDDNDLVLDDERSSRHHAEIRQAGEDWVITDDSSNGIRVNGRRIDGSAPLADGDEIIIGETTLVLTSTGSVETRHDNESDRPAANRQSSGDETQTETAPAAVQPPPLRPEHRQRAPGNNHTAASDEDEAHEAPASSTTGPAEQPSAAMSPTELRRLLAETAAETAPEIEDAAARMRQQLHA